MTDTRPHLLRPVDAAERVYNDRSEAACKRLARLADAGLVTVRRVGNRRDRWYLTSSLDAYIAGDSVES